MADKEPWPWTSDRPDDTNPGVRLLFTGMMVFTHKNGDEGRVVFHRTSPTHKLRILVLEVTNHGCAEIFSFGGGMKPPKVKEMILEIIDKDSNAAFFRGDHFDRARLEGDDKDFQWLLDLEGRDFHDDKFERKEDQFSTKLKVKHGIFYTYKHTGHYFKCAGGTFDDKEVGYVPKVVAADLTLEDDECVSLEIDGRQVLPHQLCNDARYEIYFFNECVEDCESHGDFPLTFDAVHIDPDDTFTLEPIGGDDNGPAEGICIPLPREPRLTDEAPCMGGGFGGGGGFP